MLPRLVNAQGQLLTKAGPPAAGAVFSGGIACAPTGEIYTTTTVPGTPNYCNGFLVSPAGELVVASSGTPVSFPEGIGRLANGVTLISTAAPVAADEFCGGTRVTDAGALLTAAAGGGGPAAANVRLLVHFNGIDNGVTFPDSSLTPKTAVVTGNAKLTTTGMKYGSACGTFDGSGDVVEYNHATQFLVPGDFCFEGWASIPSTPGGTRAFFATYTLPTVAPYISGSINTANKLLINVDSLTLTSVNSVPIGSMFHWAVSRQGNLCTLFLNGAVEATGTNSTNFSNTKDVSVGGAVNVVGTGFYHNGKMDDFRFVVGEPVYTAAFTPPAAELPNPVP